MITTVTISNKALARILIDMCASSPIITRQAKYAKVLFECGAMPYIRYMQKRGYSRQEIVTLAMNAVRNKYENS